MRLQASGRMAIVYIAASEVSGLATSAPTTITNTDKRDRLDRFIFFVRVRVLFPPWPSQPALRHQVRLVASPADLTSGGSPALAGRLLCLHSLLRRIRR